MTPAVLALLVAVVGVPLNVYVTWRLWRRPERKTNRVAQLSLVMFLAWSITVTVFAAIFLNNDMPEPFLSGEVTKWLTRAVLFVAAIVPPLIWLRLYR